MNYFLSEQEAMIQEMFSEFVNRRIVPFRKDLDDNDKFPVDIFDDMARQDFFRIIIPEDYDGLGGSSMQVNLGIEELSRGDAGIGVSFAVNAIATKGIVIYGNKKQKEKYLKKIAGGEIFTAFGLTEPNAGSDAGNLRTRAKKNDNNYIINGVKQFITNGGIADIYLIITVTDPKAGHKGFTAFIIEKDTEGFTIGKKEDKMGIRSSVTTELVFDECKVSKESILGHEGQGLYIALGLLDRSRIGIGAQAVGIARAALNEAVSYSKLREQFGKPIISFQAIQLMLADMATGTEASKLLVYHAARLVDKGEKDLSKISAMAKMYASDNAMKVTTDAVQIFGGYGYMKEYPVEKMLRDAKVTQIYEGTNQIQRLIIAAKL